MNIAGSLNYDTKVNTDGIESGLNEVGNKASGLGDTMKIALGNIIADLAGIAVEGLSKITEVGITYNAEIEKYQTALTTLTGSADEANQIIEQIKKDAATTPFDVQGLVEANQLLISTGLSGDEAREDILALGNAISATGGGNEELSRMAVNLQQIKNVGKASSLDIKQFAYAGIDVYGLLADSMGVTREEASDLDVTYEDLTKALKKASQEGGKYYGAMENQSKTFNGQVSNLKDGLSSLAGEAMQPLFETLETGVLPILNEIISGTGNIDELIPQLTENIMGFINDTLLNIIKELPRFVEIGIDILLSLIQGIVDTIPQLIPTIVDVILQIIDTLILNLDKIILAGIDILVALIEGIIDTIPVLVERLPEIINSIVVALTSPEMIMKLIAAGVQILMALLKGILQTVAVLLSNVAKIPLDLIQKFKDKFAEIKNVGKDLMNGLWNGIKEKWENLKSKVADLGNGIVNKFKSVFGISSPSKRLRDEVGKFLPQGIAVGIEADTDTALDAIDDMSEAMMDKVKGAVQLETGSMNFAGTNGSITQMLSAFGTTTVVNENKLYLDGDQIYENQQEVSAKKNLQTQFGGGYSVSS